MRAFSAAVLIFVAALFALTSWRYPVRYGEIIRSEAEKNGLRPELVAAVVWAESGFDPGARSPRGAVGLMQLMPATAEWCAAILGEEFDASRLMSPEFNVRLGAFYLGRLIARFDGDEEAAIAAYNAGEGNVARWLAEGRTEPPFAETRDYVRRVLSARRIYLFRGV